MSEPRIGSRLRRPLSDVGVATGVAALAAVYLTAWLAWFLPSPGLGVTRVVLFAVLAGLAWAGVAAVATDRPPVAVGTGLVLAALAFGQAVLWFALLPAGLGVAVAGALAREP